MYMYQQQAHAADVRYLVRGDSLDELFRGAIAGFVSLLIEDDLMRTHVCATADQAFTYTLSAPDETILLIDFLGQLLTDLQVRRCIPCSVHELTIQHDAQHKNFTLVAHIMSAHTQDFSLDIKAVTYHQAHVQRASDGMYETLVVCDI